MGRGGRRNVWIDPDRSLYFWLTGEPFQSHRWWPCPALSASPKPTAELSRCQSTSGLNTPGHITSCPPAPSSFKIQPCAAYSWKRGPFSKLGSSPPGISPGSSFVPFCRDFIPLIFSLGDRSFQKEEAGVMQGRWGWGHWSHDLPSSNSRDKALSLSALAGVGPHLVSTTPPCSVVGGLGAFHGFLEPVSSSPSSAFVEKEGVEIQR